MSNLRLFVAIELPECVRSDLRSLQLPCSGLRPTKAENLHLTLHFIGYHDPLRISQALAPISAMVGHFEMNLASIGSFSSRGGGLILWAGVELNPQLVQLHTDLGALLRDVGVDIDPRPFKPHITIARGDRVRPADVRDFVQTHGEYRAGVPVASVCLISSVLHKGGSIYSVEQRYPLLAGLEIDLS